MWDEETVYTDTETYFQAMIEEMNRAKISIYFETYIFEFGQIGKKVLDTLSAANKRGVDVRPVIDGIGSWPWMRELENFCKEESLPMRVHRPLPFSPFLNQRAPGLFAAFRDFTRMNQRLHRKMCVIDRRVAFVGSMNVFDANQRETGVRVVSEGVRMLAQLAEILWDRRLIFRWLWEVRQFPQISHSPLTLRRINQSTGRLWITNAYFIPTWSLLRILIKTARRGVDAKMILPERPDHFFMKMMGEAYYQLLLKNRIRVFEYQPKFLHAKTVLTDQAGWIGSSNLNHRSMLHDLELDLEVRKPESIKVMEKQFLSDLEKSVEIKMDSFRNLPWYRRAFFRVVQWLFWGARPLL